MKTSLFFLLLAIYGTCIAEDYAEFRKSCPYKEAYCLKDWNDKQVDERNARLSAEAKVRNERNTEIRKEEAAQRSALIAENSRKNREENEARIEQTRKEIEEDQHREAASKKASAARESEIKGRCGDDYHQPRIGMLLSRAQECVGKLSMSGQLNRADGVVSTYQGAGVFLHVIDGRIVSWGKY